MLRTHSDGRLHLLTAAFLGTASGISWLTSSPKHDMLDSECIFGDCNGNFKKAVVYRSLTILVWPMHRKRTRTCSNLAQKAFPQTVVHTSSHVSNGTPSAETPESPAQNENASHGRLARTCTPQTLFISSTQGRLAPGRPDLVSARKSNLLVGLDTLGGVRPCCCVSGI